MPCLSCCWKRKTEDVKAEVVERDTSPGNPRNKCALQPGHSLMDWIRLGSSGKDLTGVGALAGQLSVTPSQLKEHNKISDAWLAIRGKVYNVTEYFPFHPGGPDELMKGIGKDATNIFDEVHPWVNYESILQKCVVGRLVAIDPSVDKEALFFGNSNKSSQASINKSLEVNKSETSTIKVTSPIEVISPTGIISPTNVIAPTDIISPSDIISPTSQSTSRTPSQPGGPSPNNPLSTPQNQPSSKPSISSTEKTPTFVLPPPTPIDNTSEDSKSNITDPVLLPRFDWIQKMDSINIIFYTKAFCNPQVEITPLNSDNVLEIMLTYERQVYTNEITFSRGIHWPCQLRINYETGKVEVIFKKLESKIWDNYGVLKQKSQELRPKEFKFKYTVKSKAQVNHNTCLLELQRTDGTKLTVPLGKHVRVFGRLKGEDLSRSYTPVPCSLFTKYKPQLYTSDNVCLMVKAYATGNISKYVCSRSKDEVVELTKPMGDFVLQNLENKEVFLMIAAGTGITPMLGLLLFLLERRTRRCQTVHLLFFNKAEEDILFRNQLDTLQKEDPRFHVEHILSNPNVKWTGFKGRISSRLLQETIKNQTDNTIYTKNDMYTMVCGPAGFTNAAESLLAELEFKKDQIHLFLG